MGRRLDGFDIELRFDDDGQVDRVFYSDSEGCGHSRQVYHTDTIDSLIKYHLDHYVSSHKMRPEVKCKYTIDVVNKDTREIVTNRCTLEDHGPGKHIFEVDL